MKKLLAVLIFSFAAAFNSFSALTNQPPQLSAEQLPKELKDVQKEVSGGQDQVFDFSYETVTNKLSGLKPNPKTDFKPPGHELVPGQSYELVIVEGPSGDVSETDTTILATRIDPKTTRVQMKTINIGLLFNTRDRQIEKQRLNELSQLLSNKN